MYIGPRKKKSRSSPIRVIILLALIGGAVYIYTLVKRNVIESPFVPTPLPTRAASWYATEADTLYWEGNLKEAITTYEQAIELEPDNVLNYIPVVRLLALEGRPIEAVRLGQKTVEMAPENAQAWAALGMAYDWNGDVSEAIDACKQAIDLEPTYAEAYAYLAEAYTDAVRWVEAREAAETALKLKSHSVDVQRNYGYVLENQGDYVGAVEAYERALEIHPYLVYIQLAAGRVYRDGLWDYPAAEEHFKKAIEIDDTNAEAYDQLGWTYFNMQEYEQAETYLKKATEADPEFGQAFGHLAINYWARRNWEDAIMPFQHAISLECAASRRQAEAFYVTIEDRESEMEAPSPNQVLVGQFVSISGDSKATLQATLMPKYPDEEGWAEAEGTVTLETQSGKYTVQLSGLPRPALGKMYVGWFEGINALSGFPLSTGRLPVRSDSTVDVELETGWVEGPRIEYFYTLGLAYFYKAECEKSYPLFSAALQIDPNDYSAREGIRLCQEAEAGVEE
jgi:tetratricopeptide (TPR) repeat protein